jgi:hypothetical protein
MRDMTYHGSCHCGAVKFTITADEITKACRCNCSICRRRGAIMSDVRFTPDQMTVEGSEALALYQFGDRDVNHWFCRTCGIFPFGDGPAMPGHYRVNLGCVDGIDPLALEIRLIDGASY